MTLAFQPLITIEYEIIIDLAVIVKYVIIIYLFSFIK